jgi:hypothetical protein
MDMGFIFKHITDLAETDLQIVGIKPNTHIVKMTVLTFVDKMPEEFADEGAERASTCWRWNLPLRSQKDSTLSMIWCTF